MAHRQRKKHVVGHEDALAEPMEASPTPRKIPRQETAAPAGEGTASKSIKAGKVFSDTDCCKTGYDGVLAAEMVDSQKGNRALCFGPGVVADHPVALAIDGFRVDVGQLAEDEIVFDQNQILREGIERARKRIMAKYRKDLIGDRIDTETYVGNVEDMKLPRGEYSLALLLVVVDRDTAVDRDTMSDRQRRSIIRAILPSLQDEATILVSVYSRAPERMLDLRDRAYLTGDTPAIQAELPRLSDAPARRAAKTIEFLRTEAERMGYRVEKGREFPGKEKVYELKVSRLNNSAEMPAE